MDEGLGAAVSCVSRALILILPCHCSVCGAMRVRPVGTHSFTDA